VYVFCIIPNLVNVPGSVDQSTPVHTNIGFSLDDNVFLPFKHESDGTTNMQYHTVVFSKDSLPNQQHTLVVSSIPISDTTPALMLFDYVLYT
jgi:hypothetical protein